MQPISSSANDEVSSQAGQTGIVMGIAVNSGYKVPEVLGNTCKNGGLISELLPPTKRKLLRTCFTTKNQRGGVHPFVYAEAMVGDGDNVWFASDFGEWSLHKPKNACGSILADAMGFGKTVMVSVITPLLRIYPLPLVTICLFLLAPTRSFPYSFLVFSCLVPNVFAGSRCILLTLLLTMLVPCSPHHSVWPCCATNGHQ